MGDERMSEQLEDAVAAAFAYVSCADGELAPAERERFLAFAEAEPGLATDAAQAAAGRFDARAAAFREDFAAAERDAFEVIGRVRGSAHADSVLRAAQVAVVADERLADVEEAAVARVCEALGIDPAAHGVD